MISQYADLSGCSEINPKRDYRSGDVVRMDYSQAPKAFIKHTMFEITQHHDEETDRVVYVIDFTHPAYRLICYGPFTTATEAVITALREIGEVPTK